MLCLVHLHRYFVFLPLVLLRSSNESFQVIDLRLHLVRVIILLATQASLLVFEICNLLVDFRYLLSKFLRGELYRALHYLQSPNKIALYSELIDAPDIWFEIILLSQPTAYSYNPFNPIFSAIMTWYKQFDSYYLSIWKKSPRDIRSRSWQPSARSQNSSISKTSKTATKRASSLNPKIGHPNASSLHTKPTRASRSPKIPRKGPGRRPRPMSSAAPRRPSKSLCSRTSEKRRKGPVRANTTIKPNTSSRPKISISRN